MLRLVVLIAIVFGGLVAGTRVASARDSTWALCRGIADLDGGDKIHFVASIHEHRAPSGDKRDLSVTLLYGGQVSLGGIADITFDKPGALTTNSAVMPKQPVIFTGTGTLDKKMSMFTLKGKLDYNFGMMAKQALVGFSAKLACVELDDMAIGHGSP
jgi:hypothetical protein